MNKDINLNSQTCHEDNLLGETTGFEKPIYFVLCLNFHCIDLQRMTTCEHRELV